MNLRDALGVALIGAFIGALALLFWREIPDQNADLVVYMLGQLSGFVAGVVSYHYVMNKANEKATENTGAAFRAISDAAKASGTNSDPEVLKPGDTVTLDKPDDPEARDGGL